MTATITSLSACGAGDGGGGAQKNIRGITISPPPPRGGRAQKKPLNFAPQFPPQTTSYYYAV